MTAAVALVEFSCHMFCPERAPESELESEPERCLGSRLTLRSAKTLLAHFINATSLLFYIRINIYIYITIFFFGANSWFTFFKDFKGTLLLFFLLLGSFGMQQVEREYFLMRRFTC